MNIIPTVRPETMTYMRQWIRLMNTVLIAAGLSAFTLSCGTGGDNGKGPEVFPTANATESVTSGYSNHLRMTTDEYGLQTPNYYYSTDNAAFWSIQADIATNLHDPDFRCVIRIDIWKSVGDFPVLNKTYSLSPDPRYETFPGNLYVFNGHKSVMKKVEQGILAFAPTNDTTHIEVAFDVILTDYDSKLAPVPQYRLAAEFNIDMSLSGPADPLPAEVFPSQGKSVYERSCSACHSLGEFDKSAVNASDLSLRGGELPLVYPGSVSQHRDIGLDDQSIQALRIFLNVW